MGCGQVDFIGSEECAVALEALWNEGGADIWSLRNSIGRRTPNLIWKALYRLVLVTAPGSTP